MRPPVSVVLPFHGSQADAAAALGRLAQLELRAGDELIVVDNTHDQVVTAARGSGPPLGSGAGTGPRAMTVVRATVERSAYAARNEGAERARGDWLLFIDADCRPPADLLDRYFAVPIHERCGAIAGRIDGAPEQRSLTARYARSRRHLDQDYNRHHPYRPMAVTANLLVRRAAFEDVGGFEEHTLSGADAEFCWSMQDRGWRLDYRPEARLEHLHRDRLPALLRQAARDGAGGAWLGRRRPGSGMRPRLLRELGRSAAGVLVWAGTGRFERALFKGIDAAWVLAANVGYLAANTPPGTVLGPAGTADPPAVSVAVLASYPESAQASLLAELRRRQAAGERVEVVALARPRRPLWALARGVPVRFLADAGLALRARAAARCAGARRRAPEGAPARADLLALRTRLARGDVAELLTDRCSTALVEASGWTGPVSVW